MTLNINELKVLKACRDEIVARSGCEFGLTLFVSVRGLASEQVKGYLSILQSKGLISIWHGHTEQGNQVKLTHAGCDYLERMTDDIREMETLAEIKVNI